MAQQFDVVVEKDSAGYFVASVPVLPGRRRPELETLAVTKHHQTSTSGELARLEDEIAKGMKALDGMLAKEF